MKDKKIYYLVFKRFVYCACIPCHRICADPASHFYQWWVSPFGDGCSFHHCFEFYPGAELLRELLGWRCLIFFQVGFYGRRLLWWDGESWDIIGRMNPPEKRKIRQ